MPTITKESARQHCRTCLAQLDKATVPDETIEKYLDVVMEAVEEEEENDIKTFCINVSTNANLRELLEQYIEKNIVDCEDYPQYVCLGCFNKLQTFHKFRKQSLGSVAKLQMLFTDRVSKVELDEEDDDKASTNENIYNMMLKDALMETETVVIIENVDMSALPNVEMQSPDPFSTEPIIKNRKEDRNYRKKEAVTQSSCSSSEETDVDVWIKPADEEDDDDSCSAGAASVHSAANEEDDDDDDEDKPLSRLKANAKPSTVDASTKRPKYRRRTKKEMELVRQQQAEKDKLRDKPRKKGTKNSHRCEQCNHSFAHKLTRDAHVRKVHEGSKRPYQCDRCDKTYTFFGGLWTHIREIHEAEERSYPCEFPDCDKIYTSLIAMQKHRREKHLGLVSNKTYVCELCGTTFNQIANLKYHRRSKHPMETGEGLNKPESTEQHICTICNKQFHSRYTLKYHVLQLHSNDMKFECNVCGRRMAKKFMLVQHMRIHTLDRLPCDQCEKQFIRKHELEAHVRAVHLKLKPYGCQYCPETFACRKTLRHHEYIHTGEKPYVCEICGQAYRQQTSLKTHKKTHDMMSQEMMAKNINRTLENFLGTQTVPPSSQQQ